MPNYAQPLGALGGAAGAAGGAGILGTLGSLLEPLDYPRRALWGLLGLPESGAEVVSNATGLDKEGLPAQALGFGVSVLGDPLTYLGGFAGRLAGKGLGAMAGRALEGAAAARGPQYAGGTSKLAELLAGANAAVPEGAGGLERLKGLLASPHAEAVAGEIPQGSKFLGAGAEGAAWRTPEGGVVRLEGGGKLPPPAAPAIDEALQAVRNVTAGPYRVTHAPFVETLPGLESSLSSPNNTLAQMRTFRGELEPTRQAFEDAAGAMRERLSGAGHSPWDVSSGNVGRTGAGNWVVHDPGAIDAAAGTPLQASTELRRPGRVTNWLLDMLGGGQGVQQDISQGIKNYAGGVSLPVNFPEDTALRQFARTQLNY